MDSSVEPIGRMYFLEAKPRVKELSQADKDYGACLSKILEMKGVIRIAIDTGCKSSYLRFDNSARVLKKRLSNLTK